MEDDKALALQTINEFMASLPGTPAPPPHSTDDLILAPSFCILSHPDGLVQGTVGECVEQAKQKIGKLLDSGAQHVVESLAEPGPEVWTYGDLAAVMAGYKVLVDGEQLSGGVNFFSLLKTAEGWKIAGIADTQWVGVRTPPLVISEPMPEVTSVLETFFECLKRKDWARMANSLLPGGGITNSRPPPTGIVQSRWPDLIEILQGIVSKSPPDSIVEEHIFDLEVRIIGDVAFVWAPFRVDLDGVPQSSGVNIFTLLKQQSGWIISGIQDTGRAYSS